MLLRIIYLSVISLLIIACQATFTDKKVNVDSNKKNYKNVIIVYVDDQGYQDLGCFGAPDILTPNIDRLAKNGTRFTNFHTAQPVCTASRVSLLTGCYPNRLGMHGAIGPGHEHGINPDELTLAELFKSKDYATAVFGKWHLGWQDEFNPLNHGFDEYFGIPYSNDMWPHHPWQGTIFDFPDLPLYDGFERIDTLNEQSQLTTQITEKAVDFIATNKDQPFFLYVPHPQPHVPLYVSDKFKGKSERGLYGDVIMEIDWSVGEIVKTLNKYDLVENTVIMYSSDNGPWLSYGTHSGSALPLKEGKGTNWEGGTRVPCVMSCPGLIPTGKVSDTYFMTIDILPTMATMLEAPLPDRPIDGNNLLPLLTGESEENPNDTYAFYYHNNHLQAVYDDGYKLILPHSYRTLNGRHGTDDGLPIDYEHKDLSEPELYHLDSDKEEKQNVIDKHTAVVERLLKIAEEYRKDMGDALVDAEGTGLRSPGKLLE